MLGLLNDSCVRQDTLDAAGIASVSIYQNIFIAIAIFYLPKALLKIVASAAYNTAIMERGRGSIDGETALIVVFYKIPAQADRFRFAVPTKCTHYR